MTDADHVIPKMGLIGSVSSCFLCFFLYLALTGADNATLDFLVIGDFGGQAHYPYYTTIEEAVAQQMGKFGDVNQVDYVLALGDNFYRKGVTDIHDPRFQETYTQVFTQKSLDVDWYFLAGNHDHHGNVSAQIEFSRYLKRWQYPNYYYKQQFRVPNSKRLVDVLMIDTVLLCGNSDDFSDQQPQGPVDPISALTQWKWLEENMRESKADYLIVAGHYPVLSIGEHGPTPELVIRLKPLLQRYNVTAYFSGHDHDLQHLEHFDVSYFVSGAGAIINHSTIHKECVPKGSSKFSWGDKHALGGFGYLRVAEHNMTFTFVQANGKQLYRHVMLPRK